MQTIQTLTEFLRNTDASFRLYDMGRRVSKLSVDAFLSFEKTTQPYPLPFLHHAWIGVLLWNPKQRDQHLIWFLKLPLDEQGLLVQAARDDFLNRLASSVGQSLLDKNSEEDPLKDNPFSFTPDQEKMAAFHAKASSTLNQPPSSFYSHAQEYFSGALGFEQWNFIGLQGIADICARLDDAQNSQRLAAAIDKLPQQPLEALAAQLEHHQPGAILSSALAQRLQHELADSSAATLIGALLRGLSQSPATAIRHTALTSVLRSPWGHDIEILAAIASRCWKDLDDPALCLQFLEALANNPIGQGCFNQVIADLVFIPGMRHRIMACFRNPDRSSQLSQAIGGLFQGKG